jgi:GDP-4-dehydro-6-deoxy-D-mannose reductase
MKRAFVTGVAGFAGQHLARHLDSLGYRVAGIDTAAGCGVPSVAYTQGSILDSAALGDGGWDEVYHLAGVSYLPDADESPEAAYRVNVLGTLSLLDRVRACCPGAKTLLVGSCKEYSSSKISGLVDESGQPNPESFYGITKYAAELTGIRYARQYGLDIRFTRSFNHTGPGQTPRFVCSEWAKRVAEIALGRCEPAMDVGDLSAEIDFSDVRDVVRAYQAIIDKGRAGEIYNVCSGRGASLRWVLNHLCAKSPRPIEISVAGEKMREHVTNPRLIGDNAKLSSHTGWAPRIPLERTLDDLYDSWVGELKNGP